MDTLFCAMGNDQQFTRFCELVGRPKLAQDDRFVTNAARVRNRQVLVSMVQEILSRRTSDAWLKTLTQGGVPCGPINTLDKAFADPQVQHREMKLDLSHATAGTVPLVGSPLKLSETPVQYRRAPPTLGQHMNEVLSELLQLSDEDITRLKTEGTI